jgi:hypothetical protein
MSIYSTPIAFAKASVLASVVLMSGAAFAAGPGTGSLNKGSMTIGNCQAAGVTASWRLESLMGEPMVKGSFKWSGDSECELPSSTMVWLEMTNGSQKGYVRLPLDQVPKANAGFGRDMSRSPNWGKTVCSYSGTQSTDCYDADQAKDFWTNGRVTSFTVKWNPEDVKAIQPKPAARTSSSSSSAARSSAEAASSSSSSSSSVPSAASSSGSAYSRSSQARQAQPSSSSSRSATGTDYATEYSRQSEEYNRQHMADVNEQMRRQREIDAQRQRNIDRSAQDMANLAVMASEMDIPKPVAIAGGALFGGFVAGAVLMPQNKEGDVPGQEDFNYSPLFTSTFIALTGVTAYLRFADLGPTKLSNVQVLKSQYSLGDREQFFVTSKEDSLEGFRLSTAKYFGQSTDRSGFAIWTDVSSEKSSDDIRYAVKNDGNYLQYSTKKHLSFSGGGGYWHENQSGLIWALGVMPLSVHILDDHGYTKFGGFLYGELEGVDRDESMNFLDIFGPIRGEIVKDRLTLSALYDAQTGTSSFGLGYTWR